MELHRNQVSQHPHLTLNPIAIILPSFPLDVIIGQFNLGNLSQGYPEPHCVLNDTFAAQAHDFSGVGMVVFFATVCVVAAAIGVGAGSAASSSVAGFRVVVAIFLVT